LRKTLRERMKITAGQIPHFQGDEGVYYDAIEDRIWLIQNKEMILVRPPKGKIFEAETYWRYDVECEGMVDEKVILTFERFDHFTKIGEL